MNGLILFLCIIWGFNFVIMKQGNDVFPPVLFAAFRFLLGALVLFGLTYFKKIPLPGKRELKWYILCGLLQTTYFNIAIQISLNYISAGLTSVLTYSMPLFLSLMAHYFIPGEKLTASKTGGILIGILGVFLAMDIHFGENIWAPILALSSAVTWALSSLIFKTKLQGCDTVQFTTWQMGAGAVGLFLYSISADRSFFLFRIAGRYSLQINLKTFIFNRKGGPICDVIYNRMNELSLLRKWQKKWALQHPLFESMAKS